MNKYELEQIEEIINKIDFILVLHSDSLYNITTGEFYYAINDIKYLVREIEYIESECKNFLSFLEMDNLVSDFIIKAFKKEGINAKRIV